jgi:hypothetical protein
MAASADPALLIRVEKGQADAAELAALTAVLLARAAALAHRTEGPEHSRTTAGWRRPERLPDHRDPRGWQAAAPAV